MVIYSTDYIPKSSPKSCHLAVISHDARCKRVSLAMLRITGWVSNGLRFWANFPEKPRPCDLMASSQISTAVLFKTCHYLIRDVPMQSYAYVDHSRRYFLQRAFRFESFQSGDAFSKTTSFCNRSWDPSKVSFFLPEVLTTFVIKSL